MSTFTLAISCLTTSNLPWFMDLTFQVPMQYCLYSVYQTLLLASVTSTTGYCFFFVSIPSFFLELFVHWSPVAYWAPTDLGSSSFSILSFCLFILFMGFSRQEYRSDLPCPSPVFPSPAQIWKYSISSYKLHSIYFLYTSPYILPIYFIFNNNTWYLQNTNRFTMEVSFFVGWYEQQYLFFLLEGMT